jgi:hypothetical protein
MCTVTFIPKRYGCIVAMNRDDLRTRPQALPPAVRQTGGLQSVYPSEPGGGTWCGANERGLVFTLLNWHVAKGEKQRTRGDVIPAVLACGDVEQVQAKFGDTHFAGMLPFRLIGFSMGEKAVREWRWDGAKLATISHSWALGHWFSSGMSDEQAEGTRRPVCELAHRQADAGSVAWVRRLHRSHKPERGAFSMCVHRPDAATLSYTEILCTRRQITMRYAQGNPCKRSAMVVTKLPNGL